MILVTILISFVDVELIIDPLWIAGLSGWFAGLLLFKNTPTILRIQVGLILATGLGLLGYATSQSVAIDYYSIATSNTGLLSMIAAVGFLKLVVIPDNQTTNTLPRGRTAFYQTLLGLNISSSIINVSAPILIADRIHQTRPLDKFTAQSFVRIFCGVSSWSPFFGAMAVTLTYAAGAELQWIIMAGLPFTIVGFVLVILEARLRFANQMDQFVGYPMQVSDLKIPCILIASVVLNSLLFEDLSVLINISISALIVTLVTLILRKGITAAISELTDYIVVGLPKMINELSLFLVAGVLATGISVLINHGVINNPFTEFDAITAIELLLIIWGVAIIGIHPVIMISGLSPMILSLDPDPNLLAATYLIAWHLGTCSNPLSGTNLVFQGRYGIPGWKIAFWNWPYAVIMLIVAAGWLPMVEIILNS